MYKKHRPQHYTSDDYSAYKAIVAQTRVRTYPNKGTGSARARSTWKWNGQRRKDAGSTWRGIDYTFSSS